MKGKLNFITRVVLIALIAIGCLSYRSVSADGDPIEFGINPTVKTAIETYTQGSLVYDLYRIADIKWYGSIDVTSYKLVAEEPFAAFNGKNVGVDKTTGQMKDPTVDPKALANDAAKIVFGETPRTPVATYNVNEQNNTIAPGFYLAVIRSSTTSDSKDYLRIKDGDYSSYANSKDKTYIFDMYPVFVRGNNAADISLEEVTGFHEIKYSVEDRFGLIKIVKHVTLGGQAATIVFKIQGYDKAPDTEGAKLIYEKVLSVDVNEAGEYAKDDSLVIDDIPVGTYVVVKEAYEGASYEWYKTVVPEKGQTILPVDQLGKDKNNKPIPQTWEFYNKLNDKSKKGYGIMNEFVKDGKDWDYVEPNQTATGGEQ